MKNSIHSPEYRSLVALIKRKREDLGVTQTEMAERLGEDQSWVSKIERCERRLDAEELRSICLALEISLTSVVDEWESTIQSNEKIEEV